MYHHSSIRATVDHFRPILLTKKCSETLVLRCCIGLRNGIIAFGVQYDSVPLQNYQYSRPFSMNEPTNLSKTPSLSITDNEDLEILSDGLPDDIPGGSFQLMWVDSNSPTECRSKKFGKMVSDSEEGQTSCRSMTFLEHRQSQKWDASSPQLVKMVSDILKQVNNFCTCGAFEKYVALDHPPQEQHRHFEKKISRIDSVVEMLQKSDEERLKSSLQKQKELQHLQAQLERNSILVKDIFEKVQSVQSGLQESLQFQSRLRETLNECSQYIEIKEEEIVNQLREFLHNKMTLIKEKEESLKRCLDQILKDNSTILSLIPE